MSNSFEKSSLSNQDNPNEIKNHNFQLVKATEQDIALLISIEQKVEESTNGL